MYNPSHFQEKDLGTLHDLITRHPLAALVTLASDGINASHIPLLHDLSTGPLGTLRGHVAKANPQWRDLAPAVRALAIFTGPQHYISPSWYPAKAEHGKVVPTWNYVVVHAHGPMRVIEDREWLRNNVRELTAAQEASFDNPWRIEDAPAGYIDGLLSAIVGIEMTVEKLEGKWKASQNRAAADRLGVVTGLRGLHTPEGGEMAEVVSAASKRLAWEKQEAGTATSGAGIRIRIPE